MYLEHIYIENNGPLARIDIGLPFYPDGSPKPLVLVGGNGSGKTNVLSMVADALFEAASHHYSDVVPGMTPVSHNWFRVVGSITASVGAQNSLAILKFAHENNTYWFREKSGKLTAADARAHVPPLLHSGIAWADDGSIKEFAILDEAAREIFEKGAYAYFPASRAEVPHWLNRETIPPIEFDLAPRFSKKLRKPIYAEETLLQFRQWLLSVVMDARIDLPQVGQVVAALNKAGIDNPLATPEFLEMVGKSARGLRIVMLANQILQTVIDDPSARFVWGSRHYAAKLGIQSGAIPKIISMDALSAGQATLLGIFGTLLRYGDDVSLDASPIPNEEIRGIWIIDEIDAHMHVELQYGALPKLLRLFPRVQFIISSHSPLFVLGMENIFGADGISVVELPKGELIRAEAYSEFGKAFDVFRATKAFDGFVSGEASTPGNLVVFLEGETDPIYLKAAAELLGRKELLEKFDLRWIGAKEAASGNAFHTGKDALNHTLQFLRANPNLVKRKIVLLYDNDVGKADEDHGQVFVRSMPQNVSNDLFAKGIENLLPPESIPPELFQTVEVVRRRGNVEISNEKKNIELQKVELCKHICEAKRSPSDFVNFSSVLDVLASLASEMSATP